MLKTVKIEQKGEHYEGEFDEEEGDIDSDLEKSEEDNYSQGGNEEKPLWKQTKHSMKNSECDFQV